MYKCKYRIIDKCIRGERGMIDTGNSLSIELNVDTNKMADKLKAIAKHANALANELEAIDAVGEHTTIHKPDGTTIALHDGLIKAEGSE